MIFARLRAFACHSLANMAFATLALASLTLAAAVLSAPTTAQARSITIGSEEVLRQLQDIPLQGKSGEALYLGHKLTFHWLGLPYSFSDDGYVIGVKDKSLYYNVSGDQISGWQGQGLLPSPLPVYQLGIGDYIMGYLLWIALALVSLWWLARTLQDRLATTRAPLSTASKVDAGNDMPQSLSTEAQRRVVQAARAVSAPPRPSTDDKQHSESLAAAHTPAPALPTSLTLVPRSAPLPNQGQQNALHRRAPQMAQLSRMPVAKTRCRVKALKQAS